MRGRALANCCEPVVEIRLRPLETSTFDSLTLGRIPARFPGRAASVLCSWPDACRQCLRVYHIDLENAIMESTKRERHGSSEQAMGSVPGGTGMCIHTCTSTHHPRLGYKYWWLNTSLPASLETRNGLQLDYQPDTQASSRQDSKARVDNVKCEMCRTIRSSALLNSKRILEALSPPLADS